MRLCRLQGQQALRLWAGAGQWLGRLACAGATSATLPVAGAALRAFMADDRAEAAEKGACGSAVPWPRLSGCCG